MSGSSGGGGSSTATTYTTNLPEWLRPQTEAMLGGALQEMFNVDAGGNITGVKPYTPYSTNVADYFAGFSPLQQQAQANAANLQMPGQYNMATELAGNAGLGAFMTADQTNQYGARAFDAGQGAMSLATPAAYAGAEYGRQVTNPSAYQQYMSPYMQAVVDNQLEGARRQSDISANARQASAARSGAFGGARQAIENSEAERGLQSSLNNIQAQGLQNAFQQAQSTIDKQAQIGLQGIQAANQAFGTGIQGASVGAQAANTALNGYQLGNQTAQTLGQLGNSQLAAQQGIIGVQNAFGSEQQKHQQDLINQAILNYGNAQNNAGSRIAEYNALLRGYALPGQTVTSYQAQPSGLQQAVGLGIAGFGAMRPTGAPGSVAAGKAGGLVAKSGIHTLALKKTLSGE